MKDVKKGSFDVVIFWALDRIGRSMIGNLTDVLELDRIGVKVVSVRESWLDTSGPVRNLLVASFSWVAEQERNRLVERTKAGLASARRRGVRVGRPPARLDRDHLLDLQSQGMSVRSIAKILGVGSATVQRRLMTIATGDASSSRGSSAITDGVRWVSAISVEHIPEAVIESVLTFSIAKTNYAKKAPPLELRYTDGVVLVPLNAGDREIADQARDEADPRSRRERKREEAKSVRKSEVDAAVWCGWSRARMSPCTSTMAPRAACASGS